MSLTNAPSYLPADQFLLLPAQSVDVTLGADFDLTAAFKGGAQWARRLYVGTGGTVVAQKAGDAAAHTYVNVPSGSYLDGFWTLVRSAGNGTTASNIVAEY